MLLKEKKTCVKILSMRKKKKDVVILHNVSAGEITIWVHFDKMWNTDRDAKILSELIKKESSKNAQRKLDKAGYETSWSVLKYASADCKDKDKICEYVCKCPKFVFADGNFKAHPFRKLYGISKI